MGSITLPRPNPRAPLSLSEPMDGDEKWPLCWTLLFVVTSSTALWSAIIFAGWHLL
jgi:hypothetical protein